MGKPRIRKSAEERKAEIVDTVFKLAGEIGPDRLTTERIAQEIGISQPAIFRHFPNKAAIWDAVAKEIGSKLRAGSPVESLLADEMPDPAGNLVKAVLTHLAFIQKTPAIPAILFSRELHAENESLRKYFMGLMAKRHGIFSTMIANAIKAGQFDQDLNPEDGAFLILALIQGLAMRWSLSARQFDLVDEGERLLALQLKGWR